MSIPAAMTGFDFARAMKRCLASLLVGLLLSACSNPQRSSDAALATPAPAAAQVGHAAASASPVQASTPSPVDAAAQQAPALSQTPAKPAVQAAVVDASCKVDADCAVKDVGSCCGYRPACVNTASPTFPDQVKASCAADGRVGICGFPAITGCHCVSGKCAGSTTLDEAVH